MSCFEFLVYFIFYFVVLSLCFLSCFTHPPFLLFLPVLIVCPVFYLCLANLSFFVYLRSCAPLFIAFYSFGYWIFVFAYHGFVCLGWTILCFTPTCQMTFEFTFSLIKSCTEPTLPVASSSVSNTCFLRPVIKSRIYSYRGNFRVNSGFSVQRWFTSC